LSLAAQLAQRNLLLIFQVTTNVGIFAVRLATLGQFIILLPMQVVDLAVKIISQVFAGIVKFGLARCKNSWRCEEEGPDYKGMYFPMLVHTSLPPWQIYLTFGNAGLLVLIYED
jgi:hypothetical protein